MNYVVLFLWERCIRLYYMLIYFVFVLLNIFFVSIFVCAVIHRVIFILIIIYIFYCCVLPLLYCILFHFTFYWYDKLICNVRCILHFCCNICNILVFCCVNVSMECMGIWIYFIDFTQNRFDVLFCYLGICFVSTITCTWIKYFLVVFFVYY